MSRRGLLFGLGLFVVACLAAKEYKVGYIDSEVIISKYQGATEAKKELDAEIEKFRLQVDSLRAEYEKAQEEYKSQELTLSDEGKRAKQAEVEQRKKRYDAYVEQVYKDGGKIDQKNKELIAPIVERINSVVSRMAADEGYALVFDASKSEVIYAQPGLDMTERVIAELNRDYTPAGPAAKRKTVYAVTALYETNDEARQDRIGYLVRQSCYDLARAQPNTDVLANMKVDEMVQTRGYSGRLLGQQEALEVGRALDANFVFFGQCSKQDRKISFSLSLVDARLGTLVRTESGETNRVEDLREQVSRVVQILMTSAGTR